MAALLLATLPAEFIANDRPLLVEFQERYYFPVLADYPETTFGGDFATTADYRDPYVRDLISADGWMLWPLVPFSYRTVALDLGEPTPSPPSGDHWLGTDRLGRDMLSRAMYSARTTVIITALVIVTGGLIIGPTLGLLAGYRGGRTDGVIGRVGDVFISLPGLPMLILINASLSPRVVDLTKWLEEHTLLTGLVENWVPSYFTEFGAL